MNFKVFVACLLATGVAAVSAPNYAPKVPPLVPFQAEPFDFDDVKLTGGHLKHAQDLEADFLLSLDVDRLVAPFREVAGLPAVAKPYPGWESKGWVELPGVAASFYLSGCSILYATTGDTNFAARIDRVLAALAECQNANGDGYLLGLTKARPAFNEIERGELRLTDYFRVNDASEPYYAMEKLFSGLRDAYRIAGRKQALEIEIKLGHWLQRHMDKLPDAMLQRIMAYEYGGMNWVLSDLYVDTGDKDFQKMSQRWWDKALYDPMIRGDDVLPGKHANTQFPKFCGLLASYPYTGNPAELKAGEFFWERVVHFHSYATGGNSFNEFFGPPGKFSDRLDGNTTESCNTWNMQRMTRMLFCIEPREEQVEYFERVLYNQTLAHQHPEDGRICYYLQLDSGRNKVFESAFDSFRCCVCSSMDSHARHAAFIYMRDAEGIFVNLFAASELDWKVRGVTLTQETKFPDENSSVLNFKCAHPVEFTLKLRHPAWSPGMGIKVNGEPVNAGKAGEFTALRRIWKTGDRIEIILETPLRMEAMPDNPKRVAFFKGPVLLVGDLGPDSQPRPPADTLPMWLPKEGPLENWFTPVTGRSLEFMPHDVITGTNLILKPFYEIFDRRYLVYWDNGEPPEIARRKQLADLQALTRQLLEERTVDSVNVGDKKSEAAHNLRSEKSSTHGHHDHHSRWREADGWFAYDLKVKPDRPMELVCTWWGSDDGRIFDIMVDDSLIAVVHLDGSFPEEFFTASYPIPAKLTASKEKVTVKFTAHDGSIAGGVMNTFRVAEIK